MKAALQMMVRRTTALVIDILLSLLVGIVFTFFFNIRSYVAAYTDVFRIEAEDLSLQGYQKNPAAWASGGLLIQAGIEGKAAGFFDGPSGAYDVMVVLRDRSWQGSSYSEIQIGNHRARYDYWSGSSGGTVVRLFSGIELNNKDVIKIFSHAGENNFVGIDYLDFVPKGSSAYVVNGAMRSFRYNREYWALGYDEMNVHISALAGIPTFILLDMLLLFFWQTTVGLYTMGLKVVTIGGPMSISRATRRTLGNSIGVLFLGLGIISFISSGFRHTWGGILSQSCVVSRRDNKSALFGETDGGKPFAGWEKRKIHSNRYLQLMHVGIFDVSFVVCIALLFVFAFEYISRSSPFSKAERVEIEDLIVRGAVYKRSMWTSGMAMIEFPWHARESEAYGSFSGKDGVYDVYLAHIQNSDDFGYSLRVGEHEMIVDGNTRFAGRHTRPRRVKLGSHISLKKGDDITLKRIKNSSTVDYIDFLPSAGKENFFIEYPALLWGRVKAPALKLSNILLACGILVFIMILYWILSLKLAGNSLAGYYSGLRLTRDSECK